MKNFLFQLKNTYKQIFFYPTLHIDTEDVNHDDYWKDKRGKNIGVISSWQKERADIILRCIDKDNSAVIMDIGCADGSVLKYIKEHSDVSKAIGIDVSDFALQKAREFGIETSGVFPSDRLSTNPIVDCNFFVI